MPLDCIPDKYLRTLFKAVLCWRLGLAIYNASLLTAYCISGCVVFVIYWSSPSNFAYKLLLLPSFLSGFGIMGTLGSNRVLTEFDLSVPSLCKIWSMYLLEDMAIVLGFIIISILTIFVGSLRSVTSYLLFMSDFILFIRTIVVANRSKSSTQTVIIATLSPMCQIYMQGLDFRYV